MEGKATASLSGIVHSKLGGSNGASVRLVMGGGTGSVGAVGPTSFEVAVTNKHYHTILSSSSSFQTTQQLPS